MAYAALLSLTRTLDNFLLSPDESLIPCDELQIRSLHQKLSLFISFLEEISQKNSESIEDLEERIRNAVHEAEDIIESYMCKQILSKCEASTEDIQSTSDLEERMGLRDAMSVLEERMRFRYAMYETKNRSSFWNRARSLLCMCQNLKENNDELEERHYDDELEKRYYDDELEKIKNEHHELEKRNNEERLKNVMEKLDSIWEEVEKMNNIEDLQIENHLTRLAAPIEVKSISEIGVNEIEEVEKMPPRNLSKSASTNTSVPMVGLDDNVHRIKELLTGSSTRRETILIVGMGGIGKTTLARSIYDDPFLSHHFDVRAWTTVSHKYNVVGLLVNLLKSTGDTTSGADMEELKLKLYQSLKKRRYLIIMDDVWDIAFLKEFKKIFPDDDNGSRIIMTSRSSQVANFEYYFCHIHSMNFLSPQQSWNLLRHKALGEEPCPPGLEEIGWKIAEKCKGLPLALVVIGGLLYKGEKTHAHWNYVEENLKSAKIGNYDDVMEVLSWSYNHLPHHLKACFLYMAVYPEDYVIHISHLIRLWLAEGFIKPIPAKNLEQVAKENLDDLISRNLITICERNYYGEINTCTIHDLMRDLCMRKAREKMFLQVVDNNDEETGDVRHYVSIHRKWSHEHGPNIRSVLFLRNACQRKINPFHLKLLKVLDACNVRLFHFPKEIQKLVNLRYLAFFYAVEGGEVASSISKLRNLQTLIVVRDKWMYKCEILYLPPEILKMPWLRHLLVDGSSFSSYPCPAPNGNLQVLTGVIDFRFTEEAIQNFLNLKTLGILYRFDSETEWSFYCMENVVNLRQLENLKFHFSGGNDWRQLPFNLSFPQKLNKLTLSGCMISWKHASIIGSLPNLQVLKLKNVAFEEHAWKINEGEFTELKFLHVGSIDLEHWQVEESHFPVLECLSLSSEVVDSAYDILKEQHEFGNESLQLHIYPDKNGRGRSSICFHERYREYW